MSVWVEAARPKTLVAGVAPVLVGTAAAESFVVWRFLAALIVALSVQVAVNFANDLFDATRGVDSEARVGPRRAVASGLVTPLEMKIALTLTLMVAAAAGLALAAAAGWWLLLVGLACLVALLGYSGGPKPYGAAGLGEVSVFVFFGIVATAGSAYVQDERLGAAPLVAAVPIGLLATALLVVNNLRDIDTDAAAAKRTLAVRLGAGRIRTLFRVLVLSPFAFVTLVAGAADSAWAMLPLLALPLALLLTGRVEGAGPDLVPALEETARLEVIFAALLALGLWLS